MSHARSIPLLVISVVAAGGVAAFFPDVHASITQEAIEDIAPVPLGTPGYEWKPSPTVAAALKGRYFTEKAIKEIGDANKAVDQFDCGGEKRTSLFSLTWDSTVSPTANLPAKPCGTLQGIVDAHSNGTFPLDHFDSELIEKSNEQLIKARAAIIAYIKQRRFTAARKLLGASLHSLQDFYSHSNYLELGYADPDPRLGRSTFARGKPQLAGPTDRTCRDGTEVILAGPRPQAQGLTSGFFPTIDDRVINGGKCGHGDYFGPERGRNADNSVPWIRGINKDSGTSSVAGAGAFAFASHLATEHTRIFVREILDERDLQSDPTLILGLMGNLPEPKACDCIDPVGLHKHDPDYIDVSAVKYNETGVVVRKGEMITLDVKRDGQIIWGKAGWFFGDDLRVGPDGDATATPENHKPWVDPQIPGKPIGGLIGVIFPDDSAQPYRNNENNAIGHPLGHPVNRLGFLVDPVDRFWAGGGGKPRPMPANGLLFLTVNDGNLTNNHGCFQVNVHR